MRKLLLLPDADGYTSTDGEEVIVAKLDGGASRYRRDKIGAVKTVQAKWTLNPLQYSYWRAFFATGTQNGSLAFKCDLLSEDGNGPAEHICRFVPGSVVMPSQQGLMYVQQATLEVIPLPRDVAVDEAVMTLFESYDGSDSIYGSLALFSNVTLPDNLGA